MTNIFMIVITQKYIKLICKIVCKVINRYLLTLCNPLYAWTNIVIYYYVNKYKSSVFLSVKCSNRIIFFHVFAFQIIILLKIIFSQCVVRNNVVSFAQCVPLGDERKQKKDGKHNDKESHVVIKSTTGNYFEGK